MDGYINEGSFSNQLKKFEKFISIQNRFIVQCTKYTIQK